MPRSRREPSWGLTGATQIAEVTIAMDKAGHADQFESGPFKRRPTQVVEAQFALPFLVATALAHGRVGIGDVAGLGDAATVRSCPIGSRARSLPATGQGVG